MKRILLVMLALSFAACACGLPSAVSEPAPVSPEPQLQQAPFAGMWVSETDEVVETYVFTENSLYYVVSNSKLGQVNEQFAEIVTYDPVNSHISLRMKSIKVNGQPVGFDTPSYSLTYQIDGGTIRFGKGTETKFAVELNPTIYLRK